VIGVTADDGVIGVGDVDIDFDQVELSDGRCRVGALAEVLRRLMSVARQSGASNGGLPRQARRTFP